jgi:malic enzyme
MEHMKLLATSIILVGTGSAALAQSHPLTLRMACSQAINLVAARGAIVLNTSATTYDRYVTSSRYCVRGETTEPTWVPTADTPQCFIGYRCVIRNRPSRN